MDRYCKEFRKQRFEGVVVGEVERKNFDRYEMNVCVDFFTYDHEDELRNLDKKLKDAIKDYITEIEGEPEQKNFGRWDLALRVRRVAHGSDADLRRLHHNVTAAVEKVLGAKEYKDAP